MLSRHSHKQMVWADLQSPTSEEVRAVMREWDIHPLIADELLSPSVRQKTERYGDFLYLVLHFPSFGKRHEHIEQEIDIVVGRHVVVTATYEEVAPLRSFTKTFETNATLDQGPLGSHGGHMLYLLIQKLYRSLSDEVEYVRDELRRIEEQIFLGHEQRMVAEISRTSRIILDFRRTLAPHKEILSSLEAAGGRIFGQEFSFYARLLESEFLKVQSALDELRDSLQELRETNNSLVSTKQNETMKTLTIMAFITLPLTLITGIFGMNTEHTPIVGNDMDFWVVLCIMAIVSLVLFVYFKRKKWL
jgi:magnesium transporter